MKEETVRVVYEKASKTAKLFWGLGNILMAFGSGFFVICFLLFSLQSDHGLMTPAFSFIYMVIYVLCGISVVVGFILVKFAQLYQWYDRGGIDEEVFKD